MSNRVSGASFLSDDEFVVIRLAGGNNSIDHQTSNTIKGPVKRLLSPPAANMNNHTNWRGGEAEPQIRRITLKKSSQEVSKKKDSIASLVVDTKDSLKAPLIIETLDMEEDMAEDDTMEEGMDEKMRAKFLSKGDLPRSMRSTRRLSAFNEQLYEQQQLFLQQPKKHLSTRSRSRSSLSSSEVKAASCDGIAASQEKTAQSKGHKSIQSMPSLNNREKQPETQPIWGQFHFFPNGSQIEMEASRHHLENNPSNFSLHATATASFSSHISNSGNPFLHHGDHRYPPIVLLPSSYDLAKTANGHAGEEGCFNVILVGGCLLLVGTVSAAVALISGFI